ncbi:mitochondrial carrier domain-containing protein [Aspergillus minisclerotigenes]|uniref:Mitochondrial carrier domain-containing protein n=1 Tax=Aspergillus minisclerotigenes TaxID=656917 RepID=A0A5N6ITX3_9EURO|nr:mitochondrial carrier domain-containing protein [Aspergillus minisclerotigenes]
MAAEPLSILLASTTASLSLDLLIHPLDTIKTRIQSREYSQFLRTNTGTSIWRHPGIFRGLYQGIASVTAASFPTAGAFFITYEYAQSGLQVIHQKLGTHESSSGRLFSDFCAASVADLAACGVFAPADALKHNAQMIQLHQPDTSAPVAGGRVGGVAQKATRLAFKKFINPRQLWSGYPALVAHSLPVSAIQMPLYEAFRCRIFEYRFGDREKVLERPRDYGKKQAHSTIGQAAATAAISAAVSGGIASVLTAPMDMVRTRIMLDAADTTSPQKKRMLNAVREIIRTDGPRGLFRGCAINTFMAAVGSGLYFGLYESTKWWLGSDSMDNCAVLE